MGFFAAFFRLVDFLTVRFAISRLLLSVRDLGVICRVDDSARPPTIAGPPDRRQSSGRRQVDIVQSKHSRRKIGPIGAEPAVHGVGQGHVRAIPA